MKRVLSILVATAVIFSLFALPVSASEGENDNGFWSSLFVPSDNYFRDKTAELSRRANEKLGGVADLYFILQDFFNALNSPSYSPIKATVPNNFFAKGSPGFSIDIFAMIEPILRHVKAIMTCFVCVFTAITCYHKLRKFFDH